MTNENRLERAEIIQTALSKLPRHSASAAPQHFARRGTSDKDLAFHGYNPLPEAKPYR
jgi:hypothetical protein